VGIAKMQYSGSIRDGVGDDGNCWDTTSRVVEFPSGREGEGLAMVVPRV
jgi:hypothetical protein